jgi:hypothetical protein
LSNRITGGGGGTPAGSNKEVQYNDGGAFGAEASFEYDKSTNFLNADNIEGLIHGTNTGQRTSWNTGASELSFYLSPADFSLLDNKSANIYTRDNGGSVVPSAYDSRNASIYALFHLPEGYKITEVDVTCSVNIDFKISYGGPTNDTVTDIETGGTTNTALPVSPNHTVDAREYYIIKVDYTANTDEIRGAVITLEKV